MHKLRALVRARRDSSHVTPRWVQAFGIVALVLLVLVVVMLVVGGHGPGRHTGADAARPSGHGHDSW